MINIDSHSFNNRVLEQINKIKTALTKITPDNVKHFDDSLLRKARGVVNAVDEYKWNENSTINSISVKSIRRMTDMLKLNKMEYVVLDDGLSFYRISPLLSDDEKTYCNIEYKIPEGFDGRNSFVKHFVTDLEFRYVADMLWVNSILKSNISVTKNQSQISVNVAFPYTIGGRKQSFLLYSIVVLWRKK